MSETDPPPKAMRWYRVDLHLHTPASEDYAEKNVSYLDILREAERRGLDIIALTDHNTVAGYEALFDEIEFLEKLEERKRLNQEEEKELQEYRRLLAKITVLPGFELTSRFGSHILGIFPPRQQESVPQLKAVLNQLGVPYDKMNLGTTSVPGTQAFLEAYKIINEAGGIVIAAHVNSPTGVLAIASNLPTGTARISATQSPYLHALEFAGFHSTQLQGFSSPRWYDGANLGYERPMHCIQGSDAHRLIQDPDAQIRRWGIGDRPTEVLLAEPTFQALLALFQSQDFERVRVPYVSDVTRYNRITDARSAGASDTQVMCSGCAADPAQLCRHVVALSNSGGGVIYLGIDPDPTLPVTGLASPVEEMRTFQRAVTDLVFPQPEWSVDILKYDGQDVVQIEVLEAQRRPCYMVEGADRTIYVRHGGQTIQATHGDIIDMLHLDDEGTPNRLAPARSQVQFLRPGIEQPKSGVEVVGQTLRGDVEYYRVVDLRTGRESQTSEHTATSVWLYAVRAHLDQRNQLDNLAQRARWHGQVGLWRIYRENEVYDQRGRVKCDLLLRDESGRVERVFYAVAVSWLSAAYDPLFECEAPGGVVSDMPSSERRVRWRGNMGIEAIYRLPSGLFCTLVFRNRQGKDVYYRQVPCADLQGEWLDLLTIQLPRSGLEVIEVHENGTEPLYKFHNLGNQHMESRLWAPEMLKEGSLRHYALRMHIDHDRPLDDATVAWLGNIGSLRRSFTTADLVYRDPNGVDHIYYGARWSDLSGDWVELLHD